MKITIDFGGSIERIYEIIDEVNDRIKKGDKLKITTQHPDFSETFIVELEKNILDKITDARGDFLKENGLYADIVLLGERELEQAGKYIKTFHLKQNLPASKIAVILGLKIIEVNQDNHLSVGYEGENKGGGERW